MLRKAYLLLFIALSMTTHFSSAVSFKSIIADIKKGSFQTEKKALDSIILAEPNLLATLQADELIALLDYTYHQKDKVLVEKLNTIYSSQADDLNRMSILCMQSLLQNNIQTAENYALEVLKLTSGKSNKVNYEWYALYYLSIIQIENEHMDTGKKLTLTLKSKTENLFPKSDYKQVAATLALAQIQLKEANIPEVERLLSDANLFLNLVKDHQGWYRAQLYLLRSELYMLKGEYTVATTDIKRAEEILLIHIPTQDPIYSQFSLVSAGISTSIGNYGKSYSTLEKCIQQKQLSPVQKFKLVLAQADLFMQNNQTPKCHASLLTLSIPSDLNVNSVSSLHYHHLLRMTSPSISQRNTEDLIITLNNMVKNGHPLLLQMYFDNGMHTFKTGNYVESERFFKACIEELKDYFDNKHPIYIEVNKQLSLLYWASGNETKALRLFRETSENLVMQYNKVFSVLSERDKNLFYSDIRTYFEKFNAFMLTQYKKDPSVLGTVYDNLLANKAILFTATQELKEAVFSEGDSTLIYKYIEWTNIREKLAKMYKLISEGIAVDQEILYQAEQKALKLEEYIQLKSAVNKSKSGIFKKPHKWYDLLYYLNTDEAAIEMIRIQNYNPDSGGRFTEEVVYAALCVNHKTKRNPELTILKEGNLMDGKYKRYYKNMIKIKEIDTASYHRYWKPIIDKPFLSKTKTYYFSPDGVYNQLNLYTLYNSDDTSYVIDKYKIRLVTNTRDVITMKSKRHESSMPKETVLIGYPEYYKQNETQKIQKHTKKHHGETTRGDRGDRISELPGTKIEIETIQKLLAAQGGIKTMVLLAQDANKINVRRIQKPGIIHIATHGFFNDPTVLKSDSGAIQDLYKDNPLMLCGIMLAGAGHAYDEDVLNKELESIRSNNYSDDGILTAYEAMNMNLVGLELAILSACETGLGKVQSGEGVYGFQRALQTAGAKAILMSLWKVDDTATQKLMVYFYSEWLRTGHKLKAFETAQLKVKSEFIDPVYWGAFVMIGY